MMEFPRKSLTNVHRVDGFSCVHYHVYSIPPTDISPPYEVTTAPNPPTPPAISQTFNDSLEDIWKAESTLRESGVFVHVNAEKRELWVFPQPSQDSLRRSTVGHTPEEDVFKKYGVTLQKILTKSLSASSLVDPPSWTAPASGRGDTSVRAIQAGNLLAWEANESLISKEESALGSDVRVSSADDERSPSGVYEMFMSAILALFSYRLAKLHNYLPLNSRSFLSPQSDLPTLDTFLDTNEPLERGEVSLLVTLDIRLTNTGTLMVTSSTAPSGLFCATPRLPAESKHLQPGVTDLWLSPGGRVARYIGSVPMGTRTLHNSKDSSWEGERHDAKTHFWDGQLESIWKDRVRDWLAGRGISLAATEQEEWVAVQILFFRDPNAEDQATSQETTTVKSDDLRTTLWPAELCFLREKSEPDAFDTDLGWFHSSDDTGISDPLTFAEDWFDARLLREDILISAKSARQADELLAQQSKLLKTAVQDSNLTDEPYVRVSNYLDLHTANVVYPTPPDGTHTQGSTGAQAHIGIGSTPDNGDGGNLDHRAETTATTEDAIVRSSPTDEHVYGSDERRNSDISQLGMPSTAYDVSGGNLFRDMDADMFGTSGITEADFSFFDEPDLDDVESQIYEPNGPTSRANPSLHADVVPHHVQGGFTDEFSSLVQSDSRQHELPSGAALAIAVETADRSMDGSTRGNQVDQEALPFDAAELDDNQDAPLISFDSREEKDAKGHYFPSPPLSPISVKKKLLPTINGPLDTPGEPTNVASGRASEHGSNNGSCRQSTFEPVVFAGNLDFSDQKYKLNGRFSIELQEKFAPQKSRSQRPNIPSIGLPRRKQNSSLSNTIDPFPTAVMKEKDTPLYPVVAGEADEEKDENFFESKESDQDDSSYTTTDEVVLTLAPGLKRKRDIADDWDDLVDSTSHRPLVDSPIEEENQNWTPLLSLSRFSPDASDWCLTDYRQQLDDGTVKLANMSDQEYVRVAQILTDQVVFSSLSFSRHSLSLSGLTSPPKIPPRKEEQAAIAEVVESLFEKCSLCDLENYAAIEDKPWDTPAAVRKLPKPPRRNTTSGGEFRSSNCHFFKLPAPHIRVQRAETPIEVLSPALPFWESFGFGPVSGTKDVIAFCVYPSSEGLEDAADAFLEGLGNVYESCKLGSHTRGDKLGQSRRGLLPIIPSEANPKYEIVIGEVKEACEELGTLLDSVHAENSNIVVYMVNPFTHPGAVVDLCAGFLLLFQTYLQTKRYQLSSGPNELVFQLVPINIIASKNSVAVPTQAEYRALALEVYERCGLGVLPTLDAAVTPGNAPSILLSDNLPTSIDIKLTIEPPSSVLHEPTCLHIAYSQSIDDRWISACWTDNDGNHQMSMAYCLGRRGSESRRPFAEIAREIWETSIEIAKVRKVKWKFLIAKTGIMDPDELDAWTRLAGGLAQGSITLVLLAVDICPPLSLVPSDLQLASHTLNSQAAMYTTPVSTPQPIILSPDQVGNATTPASGNGPTNAGTPTDSAFDIDPDSSLADVTDETWGLVLSHRIHNTRSLVEHRPGLASGYIIKRGGRHDEDGIVAMSVNLLHVEKAEEAQLEEILAMYRGLGTLARLKGLTDPVKSVLPWHVAAAVKAQEALSSLM